jgi:hypothetical protein
VESATAQIERLAGEEPVRVSRSDIHGKVVSVLWRASAKETSPPAVGSVSVVRDPALKDLEQRLVTTVSPNQLMLGAVVLYDGATSKQPAWEERCLTFVGHGVETLGRRLDWEIVPHEADGGGFSLRLTSGHQSAGSHETRRFDVGGKSPGSVRWFRSSPSYSHYFGGGEWESDWWNEFPAFEGWNNRGEMVAEVRMRLLVTQRSAVDGKPSEPGLRLGDWSGRVGLATVDEERITKAPIRAWQVEDRLRGKWRLVRMVTSNRRMEGEELKTHLSKEPTFTKLLAGFSRFRFPEATNDWSLGYDYRLDATEEPMRIRLSRGGLTRRGICRFSPNGLDIGIVPEDSDLRAEWDVVPEGGLLLTYQRE